jgi:hypothetical protein
VANNENILKTHFFSSIFWENGLEKIQDGILFEISLQKFVEWKILLQLSLFSFEKLKCNNFPIFKIYNLSKILNFQNSLKI